MKNAETSLEAFWLFVSSVFILPSSFPPLSCFGTACPILGKYQDGVAGVQGISAENPAFGFWENMAR
jgi:hypothetical protein